MNPTRRMLLSAAVFSVAAGTVRAQGFPERPIRLIVPWAPGGSTDAVARALAQRMSETLGQSVVVDNKAGAAGQIGTQEAARSTPDGYTITIVELPHAIAPAVVAKLPYDVLRDFTPITLVGTSPLILFASPQFKTLPEFLKAARARAGETAVAHSGNGTVSHLSAAMLARTAGLRFNLIPYRGSAPALTDVASGQVAAHLATMASGSSLLGAGKLRALAVAGARRLPSLPDVPTFAEAGIKDLVVEQWWALVAPATTPLPVVERLRGEAAAALAHASVRDRLSALAIDLRATQRDELRSFMRAEVARWGQVAQEIGLKAE